MMPFPFAFWPFLYKSSLALKLPSFAGVLVALLVDEETGVSLLEVGVERTGVVLEVVGGLLVVPGAEVVFDRGESTQLVKRKAKDSKRQSILIFMRGPPWKNKSLSSSCFGKMLACASRKYLAQKGDYAFFFSDGVSLFSDVIFEGGEVEPLAISFFRALAFSLLGEKQFLFFLFFRAHDNNKEEIAMKSSKKWILALSTLSGVSLLLTLAYQPLSLAKATGVDGLAIATNDGFRAFNCSYRMTLPDTGYFCDTAEKNIQTLIDYNKTNPFGTFDLYNNSGLTGTHVVQGCALGFEDWSIIYGSNSLTRPYRIQKITDTKPDYVPFGFFMGVHGIRKIAFQDYSMVFPRISAMGAQTGEKNLAICLADLDGSNRYNMSRTESAPTDIVSVETTDGVWKYTFTLPDTVATSWTPRWLYVAGAFSSVTLNTIFSGATSDEDKKTYFNDLVSFEIWFDATC